MENTQTFPRYRQASASPRIRHAAYSLVRGQAADPPWVRPALIGLLGTTALLYLWNLAASGWANAYYSAAVLAGTKSWAALFFGSLDASNFITVDKAPAALWVMEISARLFGFNGWSVLAPQALEGIATVAIVYLAVRRYLGPAAGLLAGAVVALTPVAGLMFRFNNPDALLVLLITAATYATLRAIENGRTRWLVLAGALVGFGFLAKELQAFIIIPVLAGVYLIAGPPSIGRRIGQVLAAAVAVILSSGWWVAAVELMPSASRPYIGGSQNNDLISLIFGYNGFGRLTGNESGSVGGFGALGSRWGLTGWNRLFNSQFGGQISWLIPAAIILLGASLLLTFRRPRTDIVRAAFLIWGGSLLLTGAVFSFGQGIIHPYYTVALAPAIGALVGMGGVFLWQHRSERIARLALGAALAATALWAFVLLDRSATFFPALRTAVLVGGLALAALTVGLRAGRHGGARRPRRLHVRYRLDGTHWRDPLSGPGRRRGQRSGRPVCRRRPDWRIRPTWGRLWWRLRRRSARCRTEFSVWRRRKSWRWWRRKSRWRRVPEQRPAGGRPGQPAPGRCEPLHLGGGDNRRQQRGGL